MAALAIPSGMAYAELAGLSPVAGLYALLLPCLAFAAFGSSRQLVVGPDGMDPTGAVLGEVIDKLKGDGVRFAVARLKTPMREVFDGAQLTDKVGKDRIYPTVREAVAAVSDGISRGR